MAIAQVEDFVLVEGSIESIRFDEDVEGDLMMADGEIKSAFRRGEGSLRVAPYVTGFTEPESGASGLDVPVLDDVLENAEFSESLGDGLVHGGLIDMVLGVGGVDRAELKQVEHLCAVREGSVEEPAPHGRRVVRHVRHHIEMDACFWAVSDPCAEDIDVQVIDLGREDGNLPDVIFAPRHGHAPVAENLGPLVGLAEVEMFLGIVG